MRTRPRLLLRWSSLGRCLLGLRRGLGRHIDDLAAIVPAATHANSVAPVGGSAIGARRHARCGERVMRAAIVAVRARCAHSIDHEYQYAIWLSHLQQAKKSSTLPDER